MHRAALKKFGVARWWRDGRLATTRDSQDRVDFHGAGRPIDILHYHSLHILYSDFYDGKFRLRSGNNL